MTRGTRNGNAGTVTVFAVLALVATAGCIGLEDDLQTRTDDTQNATLDQAPLGTFPDGTPIPTQAHLSGCSEHLGVFPVPQHHYEDHVPEGFTLVPFDATGTTATLVIIALSCTLKDAPHSELWSFIQVQAPDAYTHDEDVTHLIVTQATTTTQHQSKTYEAWGINHQIPHGDVTVETLQETPTTRTGHALATTDDYALHMDSTVGGEPAPETAGQARAFGTHAGEVTGIMDLAWTDSDHGYQTGEATLTLEGYAPVPVQTPYAQGIAIHYWGEAYDLTFEHVEGPEETG